MKIIPILAAALLAACSQPAPTGLAALSAAKAAETDAPLLRVGLIEKGAATSLRQIAQRDGVTTWVSADGLTISTDDGLLVATRGFGSDVMGTDVAALKAALATGKATELIRRVSLINGENRIETLSFICAFENLGARDAQLPSGPVPAILYQEDCRADELRVLNLYFRTPDGRIVQTRQWAGPRMGIITTVATD